MTDVAALLADARTLRPAGDGLLTALDGEVDVSYDRTAAVYDRVIPNRLYSRLAWGTHPDQYRAFAREAVADADGPLLDAAGGSGVFTAGIYREAKRPVVFCDLSAGMLARAHERMAGAGHITFVQADATDPPFAPGSFATVACMSALHVFPDPAAVVRALAPLVAPGGRMFLSGFVSGATRVGSRYLRLLERAGEAGPPRSQAELVTLVEAASGRAVSARRDGTMAYLVVG